MAALWKDAGRYERPGDGGIMAIKDSRPIDAVVAGYLGVDIAPGFANNVVH